MTSISTVLSVPLARRVRPQIDVWILGMGPWWRFFGDFRGLERAKMNLLHAAWQFESPLFFLPPIDPPEADLLPFLVKTEEGAWSLNREHSPEDFYAVDLNEGNWCLYAATTPLRTRPPDMFRTKPAAVIDFLRENKIEMFIDCFHDDIDWLVALSGLTSRSTMDTPQVGAPVS